MQLTSISTSIKRLNLGGVTMPSTYQDIMKGSQNQSTQQQNGAMHQTQLKEKDILMDMLAQEKFLMGLYATNITESNCTQMRDMFLNHLDQLSQDQYQIFEQMNQKGYYPIKPAQPQDIQEAKQQAQQLLTELQQ